MPFKAHVSGILRSSDLPPDASVSFLKPMHVVWNRLIVGHANIYATIGAYQADERADNALITLTQDDNMQVNFQKLFCIIIHLTSKLECLTSPELC